MVTIYIGKGKKDKISKGDIVGFLCKCGGLQSKDIGRIDVYDNYAYVAVARLQAPKMLKKVKGQKIKGQKTIVEVHRNSEMWNTWLGLFFHVQAQISQSVKCSVSAYP